MRNAPPSPHESMRHDGGFFVNGDETTEAVLSILSVKNYTYGT
jgi:hypothetical protein